MVLASRISTLLPTDWTASQSSPLLLYRLVMTNIAIENGPVKILSFSIKHGDFPVRDVNVYKRLHGQSPITRFLGSDWITTNSCLLRLQFSSQDRTDTALWGKNPSSE